MAIIETLLYQPAIISRIDHETYRTKTFELLLEKPFSFVAGQHTIVRIPLDGSFRSSRHYSFSSAPHSRRIEITVAKMRDGEVSGWLCDKAVVGDTIELTQPLGKTMLWHPNNPSSLLLIAGGIGITPLMSILREHRLTNSQAPLTLLYSARDYSDLCFKPEIFKSYPNEKIVVIPRTAPNDWEYPVGTINTDTIKPLLADQQTVYVCGSHAFVKNTSITLRQLAVPLEKTHTEQFTLW